MSSFLRGASDTQPEGSRADGSFWIVLNVGCTSVRVLGAGGWRGQRRSELASEGVTVVWPISWPDAHEHTQFSRAVAFNAAMTPTLSGCAGRLGC